MSDLKLNGPYEVLLVVHVTDGSSNGKITLNLDLGRAPTKAEVDETLVKAKAHAAERGFRLMNKVEFLNSMVGEQFGVEANFAVYGGCDWDSE